MSYGYISCSTSVAIYPNHTSSFRKKNHLHEKQKHSASDLYSISTSQTRLFRLPERSSIKMSKQMCFSKNLRLPQRKYVESLLCNWLKKKKKENVIHLWQTGHINDKCTWMARIFFKRNKFWKLIGFRSFKNG